MRRKTAIIHGVAGHIVLAAKRKNRNPATGETIKIKAKKVVKFRLAKACKDAVLAK